MSKENEMTKKQDTPAEATQPIRGWPTRKAFKCIIGGNPHEYGHEVSFHLGDGRVRGVRQAEVILPWDCKSILDDSVVEMPEVTWNANGTTGPLKMVKHTRFPYQFLGEASWEEYEAFRQAQTSKSFKEDKE